MKKFIALAAVGFGAAIGAGYATHPDEFNDSAAIATRTAERAWVGVEANPVPVLIALGTFLLTIVYHKAKGKTLRESVEVAATRVTVVQTTVPGAPEPAVVKRAQARATRTQLLADQFGLENRIRKLPDEVQKAEKDACYTEQALADAERSLKAKRKAHEDAVAKLAALQKEVAAGDAELAAIGAELKRLAEVV